MSTRTPTVEDLARVATGLSASFAEFAAIAGSLAHSVAKSDPVGYSKRLDLDAALGRIDAPTLSASAGQLNEALTVGIQDTSEQQPTNSGDHQVNSDEVQINQLYEDITQGAGNQEEREKNQTSDDQGLSEHEALLLQLQKLQKKLQHLGQEVKQQVQSVGEKLLLQQRQQWQEMRVWLQEQQKQQWKLMREEMHRQQQQKGQDEKGEQELVPLQQCQELAHEEGTMQDDNAEEPVNEFSLCPEVKTVTDVYEEWFNGCDGRKSVLYREENVPDWRRKGRVNKKTFNYRRSIVNTILAISRVRSEPLAASASRLERWRVKIGSNAIRTIVDKRFRDLRLVATAAEKTLVDVLNEELDSL